MLNDWFPHTEQKKTYYTEHGEPLAPDCPAPSSAVIRANSTFLMVNTIFTSLGSGVPLDYIFAPEDLELWTKDDRTCRMCNR